MRSENRINALKYTNITLYDRIQKDKFIYDDSGQINTNTFCGDFESFYIPQETLVYFDTY